MESYRRVTAVKPAADGHGQEASRPPEDAVSEAVRVLEAGGLVVHPTSTTYGIGAGPSDLDAEIARLKGRSPGKPLLRIGATAEEVRRAHPSLAWPAAAERLAEAFWPGPLTLVLDDGTEHGLGVRAEAHPVARAVLDARGGTMSSTSLNLSGQEAALTPGAVEAVLEAMPPTPRDVLWLDAGPLPGSPPSTLLSLRGERPTLLREGPVGTDALERVLGVTIRRKPGG